MKKILVARFGALGDLILTLPVFKSLKLSGYSVTLAGNGRYRSFFLRYGQIDDFLSYESSFFTPLFSGERGSPVERCLEKFDTVLSYSDENEPFSIGLKKSFRGRIIFHPVNPGEIRVHATLYMLEPVRGMAGTIVEVPEIEVERQPGGNLVIIHPGSGSRHKNWDGKNFLEVYRKLSDEFRVNILLGYAEEYLEKFWKRSVREQDIITNPDICSLMKDVRKTAIYIGNDSGISHLFVASGVPSVVLFGPTSPSIWSPKGKNVRILCDKTGCSPCNNEERELCREKKCLDSITVKDVMNAVKELRGKECYVQKRKV